MNHEKSSVDKNSDLESQHHKSNITLIYEYVEKSIDDLHKNLDTLNTRLGILIGFDTVLMRFAYDLPSKIQKNFNISCIDLNDYSCQSLKIINCYSCQSLKIIAIICLVFSIGLCLLGLSPRGITRSLSIESLIKEKEDSPTAFKRGIIEFWKKVKLEMNDAIAQKSKNLRYGVLLLGIASICSGLDILIVTFFYNK